jgi:hypothetical protein
VYETFVELCKKRFVMQPLQNPKLCSGAIHELALGSFKGFLIAVTQY